MKRLIPDIKVEDMPFFEGRISYEDKKKYGMILHDGAINYYRVMFAKGQGAKVGDITWNRKKHWHSCCKSKVVWRHKTSCKKLIL